MTVIVTVAMFETAPSSSVTVYVKESVPLKPGSGVYVKLPSAFNVSVPSVTSADQRGVRNQRPIRIRIDTITGVIDHHVPRGRSVLIGRVIVVRRDRWVVDVCHVNVTVATLEVAPSSSVTVYVKLSVPLKPGSGVYVKLPSAFSVSEPSVTSATTVAFGTKRPIRIRIHAVTGVIRDDIATNCRVLISGVIVIRRDRRIIHIIDRERHRGDVRGGTVIIRHRVGERVGAVETRIRGVRETAIGFRRQRTIRDIRNHGGVRDQRPIRIAVEPVARIVRDDVATNRGVLISGVIVVRRDRRIVHIIDRDVTVATFETLRHHRSPCT